MTANPSTPDATSQCRPLAVVPEGDVWNRLDRRNVTLKLGRLSRERDRRTKEEINRIHLQQNPTGQSFPLKTLQIELKHLAGVPQQAYDAACEVWEKQGEVKSPEFVQCVFNKLILVVIRGRENGIWSQFKRYAAARGWGDEHTDVKAGRLRLERAVIELCDEWKGKLEEEIRELGYKRPADNGVAEEWKRVNQELVRLKLQSLKGDYERSLLEALEALEQESLVDSTARKDRLEKIARDFLSGWLDAVYTTYSEVWEKQGNRKTLGFIKSLWKHGLLPQIESRQQEFIAAVRERLTEKHRFDRISVRAVPRRISELVEAFIAARRDNRKTWETKLDAEAMELEYGQESGPQRIAEGAMPNPPDSSKAFQEYPKMVYHMDGTHKIVQNRKEHQELGPQWFQSPSDAASASPALWFRTQLQTPINEAVLNADSKFQRAKDRILKGGEITELDLKSLAVQFVLDVFPAITGQARQLLSEGLWTKHRLLDEVDKRLRHLVRYAAQRMLRPLNDDEFHAWVLNEVKGTTDYNEALRLASDVRAESTEPDAAKAGFPSQPPGIVQNGKATMRDDMARQIPLSERNCLNILDRFIESGIYSGHLQSEREIELSDQCLSLANEVSQIDFQAILQAYRNYFALEMNQRPPQSLSYFREHSYQTSGLREGAMSELSSLLKIPAELQSGGDPVEGNPFPRDVLQHEVWNNATSTAQEELHRFNAELLQEMNADPAAYANWLLRLVAGKYDIWAKRGIHVVWGDSAIQSYDQWLFSYAQSWLETVSDTCPVFIHKESFLNALRLHLISRMEFWKAEARRYVAQQKAQTSPAKPDAGEPAQPQDSSPEVAKGQALGTPGTLPESAMLAERPLQSGRHVGVGMITKPSFLPGGNKENSEPSGSEHPETTAFHRYEDLPAEERPALADLNMVGKMLASQREQGYFEDQVQQLILEVGPQIRQWPTDFLEKWRSDLERCSTTINKADPDLWTVSARGNLNLLQAQDHLCQEWLRLVRAELYQRSPGALLAPSSEPAPSPEEMGPQALVRCNSWQDIEIVFLSDERIQIFQAGTPSKTLNYGEFGFEDRRTGTPNQAWSTLRALAESNGIFQDAAKTGQTWLKVEKRIQEIRKAFRERFGISGDPLPYVEGTGYQAQFKIGCSASYKT